MKKSIILWDELFFILKIFGVVFLGVVAIAAGFALSRISAEHHLSLWLCLIPVALILLLMPIFFVRRKLRFFHAWGILSAVLLIPCCILLPGEYISSITVDTDPDIDIERYLPFQPYGESYFGVWTENFWEEGFVKYTPPELDPGEKLPVLDGSKHAFPLYSAIVNSLYPNTTRLGDGTFLFSGYQSGFQGLLDGTVDIYFGPELTQEQLVAAKALGIELELTPIASESWYILTRWDNPVTSLTESQVRDIFSGQITNWSQVGGADQQITVFQNEPDSEAQHILELFMGDTPLMEPMTAIRFDFENGFRQEVVKYQQQSNAIGFTLGGWELDFSSAGLVIKNDQSDPNMFKSPDFKATIYAVTLKDNKNKNISTVLDFICSPHGQYLAMKSGYENQYYSGYFEETGAPIINTTPNIDLTQYMPFRAVTKIVKLDHVASLRLEDHLPRIDGAAAVFPVYSAFVNAVYPYGIPLYDNDRRNDESLPDYYLFNYSNTVKGYQYLAQKDTDIFFGGYPSEDQITYAAEQGTEFEYTPIGYEAFVFFVHKDNPIDSLTTEQLKGIYSGEITNWSQVGGLDEEIIAYQRNAGSGSQSRLIRFMGDIPIMETPRDVRIDTMMGITDTVAQYRSSTASIGFSFRYYVETLVANPELKLLSIDGIDPTVENIQNGTYPEIDYLYAVTWKGNENENVRKLLDWVLSPEGQSIIQQTGYTPIGPTE